MFFFLCKYLDQFKLTASLLGWRLYFGFPHEILRCGSLTALASTLIGSVKRLAIFVMRNIWSFMVLRIWSRVSSSMHLTIMRDSSELLVASFLDLSNSKQQLLSEPLRCCVLTSFICKNQYQNFWHAMFEYLINYPKISPVSNGFTYKSCRRLIYQPPTDKKFYWLWNSFISCVITLCQFLQTFHDYFSDYALLLWSPVSSMLP